MNSLPLVLMFVVNRATTTPPVPVEAIQWSTKTNGSDLPIFYLDHLTSTEAVHLINKAQRGKLTVDEQKQLGAYVIAVHDGLRLFTDIWLSRLEALETQIKAQSAMLARCISQ